MISVVKAIDIGQFLSSSAQFIHNDIVNHPYVPLGALGVSSDRLKHSHRKSEHWPARLQNYDWENKWL